MYVSVLFHLYGRTADSFSWILQAIKNCALNHLSNPKYLSVAGMDKSHPDFKELFGWVYRGVGFALVGNILPLLVSIIICTTQLI
jgi:hypothetical protein